MNMWRKIWRWVSWPIYVILILILFFEVPFPLTPAKKIDYAGQIFNYLSKAILLQPENNDGSEVPTSTAASL